MPTVGYSIAVSQMRVFLHPSTSMFQCNNLLVSYIPVISKHFHTIVTIIKHINVIQNIYMLQLFLFTSVVSRFQVSTCTSRYERAVIGSEVSQYRADLMFCIE